MKFRPKWLLAPLALALAGLASAHWTLSGDALREELADQVMQTGGLRANAQGRASFAVLPRPRIKIENVLISDDKGALVIHADVLRGNLRLWPLLSGRMELSSVQLDQPDVSYDYEERPFTRLGAIARAAQSTPASDEAKAADRTRVGTIALVDGTARIRQLGATHNVTLNKINVTLDWPQLSDPVSLNGTFHWQDETHELAAWLGKPTDLLRGGESPASLKLDSNTLQLAANGTLTGGASMQFDGRMNASSKALRMVTQALGLKTPLLGINQIALSGLARIGLASLSLSGLKITIDGNPFEGTLALQTENGRAILSGTLAAETIVLAPIMADLPVLTGESGAWSEDNLPLASLDDADMDLRVSASKARLGRATFEDIGASLQLNNGRLDVAIGQAKIYGGQIKGRMTANPGTHGLELRANGAFADLDADAMSKDTFRVFRISGTTSGQFEFAGHGETMATLVRSLDGTMETRFRNGDLHGIDLERALRSLERRPLSILTDARNGRTGFETAIFTARLTNGTIDLTQALISGLGVQVAMTGTATTADRKLNLRAVARQSGPGTSVRENGPQLMLDIRGPWDEPQIIFDKESLMRRSDAAAPLLRALEKNPAVSAPVTAP